MIENRTPAEPTPATANKKWIWWLVGGGCALLLCLAIVVGAVILYFMPVTVRYLATHTIFTIYQS